MPSRERRGFTLIEVIVVLVIIGVMASAIVPRFAYTTRRSFDHTVEQLADLMTMFAQRDQMSTGPVGIFHDTEANWITLVRLVEEEPGNPRSATWQIDRHVRPVKLPEFIPPDGVSASENGEPVDFTQWPLMSVPGEIRPTITLTVSNDAGDQSATLLLSAYAVGPRVLGERDDGLIDQRQAIDLDATGQANQDW